MNTNQVVQSIREKVAEGISEVYFVACGVHWLICIPRNIFWIVKRRNW